MTAGNTDEDFIQTDTAINPGNSGGVLVDIEGRLIGINAETLSRSGGNQSIGFCGPIEPLPVGHGESLVQKGHVGRGFLGADIQNLKLSTENQTANANTPKNNINNQDALHGVAVADLDQQTRAQLNIPASVQGALITEVDPTSAAYEAGLRTGNVILQIGNKPVTDAQDAVTDTAKRTGDTTLVRVWSREGIHYLTVKESNVG